MCQSAIPFSPANLNNLLEGEELGPSCGIKWDARRDKDGFKLPEEPREEIQSTFWIWDKFWDKFWGNFRT